METLLSKPDAIHTVLIGHIRKWVLENYHPRHPLYHLLKHEQDELSAGDFLSQTKRWLTLAEVD